MIGRIIAAIYVRKSTDQTGRSEDARSIARQIDRAREYAAGRGWIVLDEFIYVDDGISGTEFEARPRFMGLMAALESRPPFQMLIVMDLDRLGRDQIDTLFYFKRIIKSGVRVWSYLEDRELTLANAHETLLLSVQAVGDQQERDKARLRTHDALQHKARAGYVTRCSAMKTWQLQVLTGSGRTWTGGSLSLRRRSSGRFTSCTRTAWAIRGSRIV